MADGTDDQSVTAVVTRRIVPGRQDDYQAWVRQVGKVAGGFAGHQGTTYKVQGEGNECHVVFRFDTLQNLRQWENSDERKHWSAKLDGIIEGESRIERLTGLEFLFRDQLHPKAYKMALVLTVTIFFMLLLLNPIFDRLSSILPHVPEWLSILLQVFVQVSLLTYLIMPGIMRILAGWLGR